MPISIHFDEAVPEEQEIEVKESGKLGVPKRLMISEKDLNKYGFTTGCIGCDSRREGRVVKRNHSEQCRACGLTTCPTCRFEPDQ